MSLLDKHLAYSQAYGRIRAHGADPFSVRFDSVLSPTEGVTGGRRVILLGTNNYLGLTFDPSCIEAAAAASMQEGSNVSPR